MADTPSAPNADNAFDQLPFPVPGDPIRSNDIGNISRALTNVRDAYVLSAVCCGQDFGKARGILAAQGYTIERAITVYGVEMAAPEDASLDARKTLHIYPSAPGTRKVIVILSERQEERRFMPNLTGRTYREAQEMLRQQLGEVSLRVAPLTMPDLRGMTVAEARSALARLTGQTTL